jgi:hypothetical protein
MQPKQILQIIAIILALGLLTSCLDSILPGEAAEAYLRENSNIPSFDTEFKEIATNDGVRAQVIVWANVKLQEAREPEECETIVTVEKRGDSWKGRSATPFRPINHPPTSSLSDIEVVEMGDQPGSFSLFNHADHWLYSPSEKRTYTHEIQYLTWRASADALRLHEEGKLKGKSDVELRSLAAEITKNVAYSVKDLNAIADTLRRTRTAMGKTQVQVREVPMGLQISPLDIFRGIFPTVTYQSYQINEGNLSEMYPQKERFIQALRDGHLKENEPYVQRMKDAYGRMFGTK